MIKSQNSFTLQISGLLALAALLLSGCGSPAVIYAGNVQDATATAQPAAPTAQVSPAVVGATAAAAIANTPQDGMNMPGMSGPTPAPVTIVAANSDPKATVDDGFVVAWLLFGTPTSSGKQPEPAAIQQRSTPAVQPTVIAAAITATPTGITALPPTATHSVATATQAQNAASSASSGDVAKGKSIFNGVGTCNACHDVANGVTIVGPSLKGIASRAGTRKPGMSAVDYLHESIVSPNAYVVPGFAAGVMLQTLGQTLSAQQINDVIAYLLTLK